MCDRGREKGFAIRGRGEGVVLEIVTDPRCDNRVLLQEILKDRVIKVGPTELFDFTSRDGCCYKKS